MKKYISFLSLAVLSLIQSLQSFEIFNSELYMAELNNQNIKLFFFNRCIKINNNVRLIKEIEIKYETKRDKQHWKE